MTLHISHRTPNNHAPGSIHMHLHSFRYSFTSPALGPVMNLTCNLFLMSTFSLNVSWSPPDDNDNALTSYQVNIKRYVSGEDNEVTTNELREPRP